MNRRGVLIRQLHLGEPPTPGWSGFPEFDRHMQTQMALHAEAKEALLADALVAYDDLEQCGLLGIVSYPGGWGVATILPDHYLDELVR